MSTHSRRARRLMMVGALTMCALSGACSNPPPTLKRLPDEAGTTRALRNDIDTIVVIYAENRAFDNLYGNFPGARGLSEVLGADGRPTSAYVPQIDRDGKILATLPPAWGGVTAAGFSPVVTQQQSVGLPNAPFSIEHAYTAQSDVTLSTSTVTRDLWHRFFEHQMQIDGGKNDGYAAWSDAGGLAMGHYDYSRSALYKLAQEFVLADNFFQGAFGGSFLNHQYLICACAPEYPEADSAPAKPSITILEQDGAGGYMPRLKTASNSASALDAPPAFVKSGNITPRNYFGDGKFLRRQHHAARLPAERQRAGRGRRQLSLRRSGKSDHSAAASRADDRRYAGREARPRGRGTPDLGERRSPTAPAHRIGSAQ